jgi:hypothetical protein
MNIDILKEFLIPTSKVDQYAESEEVENGHFDREEEDRNCDDQAELQLMDQEY